MPGKAAYRALEDDPELEFEFFLAQKLSMTVAEMRARMGSDEFVLWSRYFARKAQQEQLQNMMAGG